MKLEERNNLVWLSAVTGIGAQTLKKVLDSLCFLQIDLREVVNGSERRHLQCGLTTRQSASLSEFKKQFSPLGYTEMLLQKRIVTVCFGDQNYPTLLKEIYSAPVVLYVKGPSDFGNTLPISVVGTRRLTSYGEHAAKIITGELVDLGATIVSGFMYGADMQAHLTALRKHGKTIGVLGYGFEYLDTARSEFPVQEFLETDNTFLTEYAPFVPASKGNFPARNRIVAGLSHATLVVEAAQKSGSLITAQCALDYGRLVCAVPGPFTSIYSEGTKHLINQGARLVTSGLEIISEIQPTLPQKINENVRSFGYIENEIDREIMSKLWGQSCATEELALTLKLEISATLSRLSMLEVQGLIHRVEDKWWSNF